jgi:hypothetical protein
VNSAHREHVVDSLSDGGVSREFSALGAQPGFQSGDPECGDFSTHAQPIVGAFPTDVALDVEDFVDAIDGLKRHPSASSC